MRRVRCEERRAVRPPAVQRLPALVVAGLVALAGPVAAGCGGDDDNPAADVDMVELRDVVEAQARESVAVALYENPGSRADLLAGVPTDDPELWAEINADGEITLDEFRSIDAVANVVLTHSDDIVDAFQDEAVRQVEAAD